MNTSFPKGCRVSVGNANHGEKRQKLARRRELVITYVLISIVILGSYGFVFGLTWALNTSRPFAVVEGTSMLPTYQDKDLVILKGVSPSEIKLGDVIVYHKPHDYDNLIIHRVIEVTTSGGQIFFRAKGDNNVGPDLWLIPADQVVGKVIFQAPAIGLLFLIVGSPLFDGFTLGNCLSIILIALLIFATYRTPIRKKKEEAENPVGKESYGTERTI